MAIDLRANESEHISFDKLLKLHSVEKNVKLGGKLLGGNPPKDEPVPGTSTGIQSQQLDSNDTESNKIENALNRSQRSLKITMRIKL